MKPGRIAAITVLVVALSACSSLGKDAPPGTDLTGVWRLDERRSESVIDLMRSLRRASSDERERVRDGDGARMRGGNRGQGNSPGAAGGMSSRATPGNIGRLSDTSVAFGATELDIEQRADATRVEYDGKMLRVYRWGVDRDGESNGWRNSTWVVATKMRRIPSIERTFRVSESGTALTVVTNVREMSVSQVFRLDVPMTRKLYPGRVAAAG